MAIISGGGGGGGGGVTQLSYVEFTSPVSITSTSATSPTLVVSAAAVTFDGATLALVEFYAPATVVTGTNIVQNIDLWDGSTNLGHIAVAQSPGSGAHVGPVLVHRLLTPASGSHTFLVQSYLGSSSAVTVEAGSGGSAAYLPGYIRVTSGS